MRIRSGALILCLATMAHCLAFGVQAGSAAAKTANKDKVGAGVVRLIAAAERAYFRDHERYASFSQLV